MNTDTLLLFSYFLEYVLLFLDDNVDEECEWFKSSTSGYYLAFACIGVAYKSVAYKKSVYYVETKIIWDYIFYMQLGSGLYQPSKLLSWFSGSNLMVT